MHLNGKQALGYARIRKLDSEFVRTGRQFKVLNMIFAKFRKFSVTKQYDLLYKLLPLVETSMTNDEIIDAAAKLLSTGQRGLMYYRLPIEGLYQNGKWEKHFVFFCDMGAMSVKLNEFVFHNADEVKSAVEQTPNPSLPPRTPSPVLPAPDDGSSSGWSTAPGFGWGNEE